MPSLNRDERHHAGAHESIHCLSLTLLPSFPRKREPIFQRRWLWVPAFAGTTRSLFRSFNNDLGRLHHRTPGFETLADQLAHLLRRTGERIGLPPNDERPQLPLLESL